MHIIVIIVYECIYIYIYECIITSIIEIYIYISKAQLNAKKNLLPKILNKLFIIQIINR